MINTAKTMRQRITFYSHLPLFILIIILTFASYFAMDSTDPMASHAHGTDDEDDHQLPSNIQVEDKMITNSSPSLTALHERRRQKEAIRVTAMARFEHYARKYNTAGKHLTEATSELQQIVSNNDKPVDVNADRLSG